MEPLLGFRVLRPLDLLAGAFSFGTEGRRKERERVKGYYQYWCSDTEQRSRKKCKTKAAEASSTFCLYDTRSHRCPETLLGVQRENHGSSGQTRIWKKLCVILDLFTGRIESLISERTFDSWGCLCAWPFYIGFYEFPLRHFAKMWIHTRENRCLIKE